MNKLYIAVRLEMKDDKIRAVSNVRNHIGTIYFPEGTTANDVCKYVMKRQQTKTGLWLLQMVRNPILHSDKNLEDGNYITVKDSKHRLEDGTKYVAVYYNGPPVFLDNL